MMLELTKLSWTAWSVFFYFAPYAPYLYWTVVAFKYISNQIIQI